MSLLTDLEPVKQIHDRLVDIATQEAVRGISVFPGTVNLGSLGMFHTESIVFSASSLISFTLHVFPACSLSGSPSVQRWYFAVQACQGAVQVRHRDGFVINIYVAGNWESLNVLAVLYCDVEHASVKR